MQAINRVWTESKGYEYFFEEGKASESLHFCTLPFLRFGRLEWFLCNSDVMSQMESIYGTVKATCYELKIEKAFWYASALLGHGARVEE